MKHIRHIFKISIVLLLLLVCVGSIYAADNGHAGAGVASENEDFDLEDLDDVDDDELDEDDDDFDDEDLDDEEYEDDDDFDDEDDDEDWEDEDDEDDEDDDEDWEDEDDNESYYSIPDFQYLNLKIVYYLDSYGNYSGHNWTESEEFISEYQIYLADPSNYTLNETSEGYETYLKIFDSITSTFGDYNLTENETSYLKFMVIFYLNHYGNVSANYTWNESESFSNFTLPDYVLGSLLYDLAAGKAIAVAAFNHSAFLGHEQIYGVLTNSTDVSQASAGNQTGVVVGNSLDVNIFVLVLIVVVMFLLII